MDNDEEPLQFYDSSNQTQWQPTNHYDKQLQSDDWQNMDLLIIEVLSDDLLLQFLADYHKETKTVDRGNYILKINPLE